MSQGSREPWNPSEERQPYSDDDEAPIDPAQLHAAAMEMAKDWWQKQAAEKQTQEGERHPNSDGDDLGAHGRTTALAPVGESILQRPWR